MAISKRILTNLIEKSKITISPYDPSQLTQNGYKLKCGTKIAKFENNSAAYLTAAESNKPQTRIEYEIPETGVILEPRRIYEIELVETVESEDYSIQIVPWEDLASYGISLNVASKVDYNPPGRLTVTLTSTQHVTLYPNQVIAMAYFTSAEGDGIPSGGIIMWSGNVIPSGWLLCDGTEGTPDLRDRFVLGWGSRNIGDVGGEEMHTLKVSELPSHSHIAGALKVTINTIDGEVKSSTGLSSGSYAGEGRDISVTGMTEYTGSGVAHNNMPPYYVLAFIMKE